jgi:hypothetical protein
MSYNLKFSIKSKGEDKNNDNYYCDTIKGFEISVPQSISRTNSNSNTNTNTNSNTNTNTNTNTISNNMPKKKLIMILLK